MLRTVLTVAGVGLACAAIGLLPMLGSPAVTRFASLLLFAGLVIPVVPRMRNAFGASLMVGAPFLAIFLSVGLPQIGVFTWYSSGDDWWMFQRYAYRIFLQGYWLEAGQLTFWFQPFYRYINGALHMVFGDSSAGETLLDAALLLSGALLTFSIVKMTAGFRWAIAAGAAVLITYAVGTTWYFVGRGLSEIASAGVGFLAAFLLLRGRLGRIRSVVLAGACCGLMFYTRLNFLIAGLSLAALLLPMRVSTSIADVVRYTTRFRLRSAVVYAGVVAGSVCLFMTRTWWYTGRFSALYGTSLKNNDIGLRFDTVADPEVWQRIRHSLATLVFVNEPPQDRKSTRLNSSHMSESRMPSSA